MTGIEGVCYKAGYDGKPLPAYVPKYATILRRWYKMGKIDKKLGLPRRAYRPQDEGYKESLTLTKEQKAERGRMYNEAYKKNNITL